MLESTPLAASSNYPETPPNTAGQSVSSVRQTQALVMPIRTQTLYDLAGREQNLDGTPRLTYKHPHF